jgi:acyl-CoA-binding protein
MDNDQDLGDLFEDATHFVRLNAVRIPKDKLLYLYARYKQATDGVCVGEKPTGIFNFEAKSKYDAWKALGSMSKETAMNDYIFLLNSLFPEWQPQCKVIGRIEDMRDKSTFGIRLSTMTSTEDKITDFDKSVFDWCKEGSLANVVRLTSTGHGVDQKDENGMTLLMWACDRGHMDIVRYLIDNKANLNERDIDGQTCLHYAVSCEHLEIVKTICSQKDIGLNIMDNEGLRPVDIATNSNIAAFLSGLCN